MEYQAIKGDKGWRIWWQLTRPHTLTAAFVPVFLGTVLALSYTELHWGLFSAMLVASLLIQAATNMFNEYFDYVRGLDSKESVGIGGAIVRNGVKPKTVLYLGFSFFAIALLLGIYICMLTSWWLAVIGIVSMAAGYFYTGGPVPIAYTPFGEITAGFFMGMLIIIISFFIQTLTVEPIAWIVSFPIGLLVGAILLANNIRDLDGDKENGRKTIAILLGRKRAVYFLATLFIVSYAWVIGLIVTDYISFFALISFLSIPKAIQATKGFIGKTRPIEMMPAMQATAKTNTFFGFLLGIGLLLQFFILS
ncbi:1,4-dihydroxy-2-naphthoate polyprenyltransferase [Bacillus coahuilensis]|uniref:1,4-dihydroxy-2-naphthoate polyprenyltransferase n=1 Tax=Bacillus coahuilensis TaxID=408580 RepID=UPI0001851112|nr:1,4-dihydroxy-2-naphthoate polyprenyltransferase [Bacillus coahuilensis]